MAAVSCQRAELDRVTFVEAIRGVFARSPIFCGAALSEPRMGPGGDVTVEVSFEQGRPALRVTAASDEKAYAILHELASTMVEIERAVRLRGLGEVRQGIGAGKVQPSQESTGPELATAGLPSGELRWLLGLAPPPPVFARGREDR